MTGTLEAANGRLPGPMTRVDPSQPADSSSRFMSFDAIRGFALLGILAVNIQSFASPSAATWSPIAPGDSRPANLAIWIVTHALAHEKFITMFATLFGAGILLMTQHAESSGRTPVSIHYRRMSALAIFGLAHAYLLWSGDVLFPYAVCGSIVFLLRRARPAYLLAMAGFSLLVGSVLIWAYLTPHGSVVRDAMDMLRALLIPQHAPVTPLAEMAAYRSGWWAQMIARVPGALESQTITFAVWTFWRIAGLMLAGMAFLKLGILGPARQAQKYWSTIVFGFGLAIPITLAAIGNRFLEGWGSAHALLLDVEVNYWCSLLISAAWMSAIIALVQWNPLHWLVRGLACMGRMAFTNYVLQSVLCTALFYGHGLGLFGTVDRIGQSLIVLAIWMLQFCLSWIWLSRFSFGPAEWVWRTITYWKIMPVVRRPLVAPARM